MTKKKKYWIISITLLTILIVSPIIYFYPGIRNIGIKRDIKRCIYYYNNLKYYVPDGIWGDIDGDESHAIYINDPDTFGAYGFHKLRRTAGKYSFNYPKKELIFTFTDDDPKLTEFLKKLAEEKKYYEEGQEVFPEEKKIITHIKFPLKPCKMGYGTFPFGDRIYQKENKNIQLRKPDSKY